MTQLLLLLLSLSTLEDMVLAGQLGHPRWTMRQAATTRLIAKGELSAPVVWRIRESKDAEVAHRARYIWGYWEFSVKGNLPSIINLPSVSPQIFPSGRVWKYRQYEGRNFYFTAAQSIDDISGTASRLFAVDFLQRGYSRHELQLVFDALNKVTNPKRTIFTEE